MDLTRPKVLLVDFDDDLLITLQRLLEDAGFDTLTTWDFSEGLELFQSHRFAVVVVGHRLPQFDAARMLAEFSESKECRPCIVLHSNFHCAETSLLRELGAFAIVGRSDLYQVLQRVQELADLFTVNPVTRNANEGKVPERKPTQRVASWQSQTQAARGWS